MPTQSVGTSRRENLLADAERPSHACRRGASARVVQKIRILVPLLCGGTPCQNALRSLNLNLILLADAERPDTHADAERRHEKFLFFKVAGAESSVIESAADGMLL